MGWAGGRQGRHHVMACDTVFSTTSPDDFPVDLELMHPCTLEQEENHATAILAILMGLRGGGATERGIWGWRWPMRATRERSFTEHE